MCQLCPSLNPYREQGGTWFATRFGEVRLYSTSEENESFPVVDVEVVTSGLSWDSTLPLLRDILRSDRVRVPSQAQGSGNPTGDICSNVEPPRFAQVNTSKCGTPETAAYVFLWSALIVILTEGRTPRVTPKGLRPGCWSLYDAYAVHGKNPRTGPRWDEPNRK